ncbi:GGDEF domain-containing protein [Alkaliphilus serpentinus]|uniref:Diguanylate cyclase n=1 Tax=Alkaliphilus serpentinus TaxID=1482731 RepID=A0A833HR67_9FIRM|nr:diguanylate cyclase [Alkaliphilus serpentinus]KAB3532732.1 diguanylate cyclase [Alkaliphilus serpentinus]
MTKDNKDYYGSEIYIKNQYIVHQGHLTRQYGRCVSFVAFFIMLFSLYVDINIFKYPKGILIGRVILTTIYALYFIFTFTPYSHSPRRVIKYYIYLLIAGMLFAVFFNVLVFQKYNETFDYRGTQVLFLFMLSTAFFPLGGKDKVVKIITYPVALMVIVYIFFKDMGSLSEWFKYLNVFITILLISLYYNSYLRKDYAEFKLKKLAQLQIHKLSSEIESRKNQERVLQRKANVDELTGIYNRRNGLEELEDLMILSDKDGRPLSICYIDLDNLKRINDTYGHSEGDTYIKTFVDIIEGQLRSRDLFIRLGGDEFLIVLWNTTPQQAEKIWSRIQDHIDYCNRNGIRNYKISASHGIETYFNSNYEDVNALIETADRKMYFDKKRKPFR